MQRTASKRTGDERVKNEVSLVNTRTDYSRVEIIHIALKTVFDYKRKTFWGSGFSARHPTADVCRQGRNGADCVGWLRTRLQVGGFEQN